MAMKYKSLSPSDPVGTQNFGAKWALFELNYLVLGDTRGTGAGCPCVLYFKILLFPGIILLDAVEIFLTILGFLVGGFCLYIGLFLCRRSFLFVVFSSSTSMGPPLSASTPPPSSSTPPGSPSNCCLSST